MYAGSMNRGSTDSRVPLSAAGASPEPAPGTTARWIAWPEVSSGTPTTAHSSTPSTATIACSTAVEEMFSPNRRMVSGSRFRPAEVAGTCQAPLGRPYQELPDRSVRHVSQALVDDPGGVAGPEPADELPVRLMQLPAGERGGPRSRGCRTRPSPRARTGPGTHRRPARPVP